MRALDRQSRPHDFDFLLRTYRYRDLGGTTQYAVAFEMPISNITAIPEAGVKKHRLHASLLALVKDANGRIVDRASKDVQSEVADDHLAAVRVEIMTYSKALNLPPGRYTVEAAVVDQLGNRAATDVTRIDNREQPGLGMSDIALVRRLGNLGRAPDAADPFEFVGKRVLPFVTADLYAGDVPFLYFVVYPEKDNPATAELRTRFFKDGRVVIARKITLPPPDSSGIIPEVLTGDSSPGSHEVTITGCRQTPHRDAIRGRVKVEIGVQRCRSCRKLGPRRSWPPCSCWPDRPARRTRHRLRRKPRPGR